MILTGATLAIVRAAGMFVAPLAADAQQPRTARIGWLAPGSIATHRRFLEAFRQGLRELDYVEGSNLVIDYR